MEDNGITYTKQHYDKSHTFSVSEKELKKFEKWRKKLTNKGKTNATIGGRFKFCFTPTGLGDVIEVIDIETKKSIDITDWDNW